MNKILPVLLPALLVSSFLSAQKKEKCANCKAIKEGQTIHIKYLSDDPVSYEPIVRKNSTVKIVIEDVNLKVLDVGQKVEKHTYNETVPKIFEKFTGVSLPEVADGSAGAGPEVGAKLVEEDVKNAVADTGLQYNLMALETRYETINNKLVEMRERLNGYRAHTNHMRFLLQYQVELLTRQTICNKPFDTIIDNVNILTKSYFADEKMGLSPAGRAGIINNSSYTNNRIVITKQADELITQESTDYDVLIKLFAPGTIAALEKQIDELNKDVQSFTTNNKSKPNSKAKAGVENALSALEVSGAVDKLSTDLQDLKYLYDLMDLPKVHAAFAAFADTGKADLLKTYDYFDKGNFTKIINIAAINDDEVNVNLDITPKDDAPCPAIPKSYEFTFRPKGRIKIDFSTGLFMNFGGNDFKDQSYRYDPVDGHPDSSVIRKNNGKNSVFPSVGGLMHIYWRNGKDFRPAIAIGISTKDLDKINYHLGGSLIFGYSQRFIISGGVTMTKTTLIDDKYEEGQVVAKPDANASVPTSSFNRFGAFFSFTYNITSK